VSELEAVRARLRTFYGTAVPASIARLAMWLAADQTNVGEFQERALLESHIEPALAMLDAPLPARDTFRYSTEPPEYIPIAGSGNDGESIGLLQRAPELGGDELPFISHFPAAFGAEVCDLGADLPSALANFVASYDDDTPDVMLWGLFDDPVPRGRYTGEAPLPFQIPAGYRFSPSADRVGVLAPADAFGDETSRPSLDRFATTEADVAAAIAQMERVCDDGYPATAIGIARDLRYHDIGGSLKPALATWRRAAAALNRPWHVAMLDELGASSPQAGRT
jgi:hypothetical protein